MAGNLSTYMENLIVNYMRGVTIADEAAMYIALFTADDGLEGGTITSEVSGGSYARELAGLTASADGESANAANVTFTTATANWGTVTHLALIDSASGAGNVVMHGALTSPRVVDNGNTFQINLGDLELAIT